MSSVRSESYGWAGLHCIQPGCAGLVCGLVCGLLFGLVTGCGTPTAPQPPSLRLPAQVEDLTARRAGETVTLHWTNPKKTIDRMLIKGAIAAQICRVANAGACEPAGETSALTGAQTEFHERLPAALLTGEPRVVRYFVELRNGKGRTAGPSNMAAIAAGSAPGAVTGLSAEVRADGVALHWDGSEATAVRLHRRLLSTETKAQAKAGKKPGVPASPKEPLERDLIVEKPAGSGFRGGALDEAVRFGQSYEYRVQRVVRVGSGGDGLELDGPFTAPVQVEVVDRFPPAVPHGLASVASGQNKSIDLSWEPDTDADLAGYIVYRAEDSGSSDGGADVWRRVSGAQPLAAAAYRDLVVEAGRSYRYRVTAIDQTGHESAPSADVQESMPNP